MNPRQVPSSQAKERHKRKFDNLLARQSQPQSRVSHRVVNLSSKHLDVSHISVLSRGLNFAPAPTRVPTAHFVTSIEAAIRQSGVSENVAAKARMSIIGAVSRARMPPRNVTPRELKARDENILVLPADKGKATVVMNRTDYDAKMLMMLKDESTYRPLEKDPTSALERRMNSTLMKLKQSGRLPDRVYACLRRSAGKTPLLYGLPKVHKPDVPPLCPIVSFVSSPTYRLSKFLAGLLAPVVGQTTSHVRNSKDFAEFISKQTLTEDEVMVSFDVVSLFTCVPTDLAVQVARRRLEKDQTLPERTDLSVDDIMDLLTLCLNSTFLQFTGKVYQQVYGTAMGSPVSVVIANLVMEDVEERATTFHPPPRFWRRYVDDTFTALPRDLVQQFLRHLNSIEPCIQFTAEEETEGKLPFLDVCLQRDDNGSLTTSVFRKATQTNQYLSFDSYHPMAHKAAVVRTLMHRASTLSSNSVERVAEEKKVVEALRDKWLPIRVHPQVLRQQDTQANRR